jgi:hypothetical protein
MKRSALALLALAVIWGCTSEAPKPAPKPQAPEALTGRSAFQQLYVAARGWAGDIRPYQLQSSAIGENNGHEGKSVVWRAAFASPSMRKSRPYSWSGIDSPDAPSRGVSPGNEDTYSPGNDFDLQFLKIDSDKAFEVAQKHGGEKVLQANPKLPVTYLLDWNRGSNNLVWHVFYGGSRNDAKLILDVDATTGEFLRKEG